MKYLSFVFDNKKRESVLVEIVRDKIRISNLPSYLSGFWRHVCIDMIKRGLSLGLNSVISCDCIYGVEIEK